jgi:hypothetical protein
MTETAIAIETDVEIGIEVRNLLMNNSKWDNIKWDLFSKNIE